MQSDVDMAVFTNTSTPTLEELLLGSYIHYFTACHTETTLRGDGCKPLMQLTC